MTTFAIINHGIEYPALKKVKAQCIESIDLLRGIVIIIMALDNVRDYFTTTLLYIALRIYPK